MKKLISIIMIATLCCAFTACKNDSGDSGKNNSSNKSNSSTVSNKKPSEKANELLSSVTFPEMVSKDMEFVEVTLGITADMVSEHVFYICGSGAMPDEFGIFVATSAENASQIKDKLGSRVEYQRDTYSTYSPDEAYKLTDCFVDIVNGNTVIYAVCADNSKAREILK